MRSRMRSQSTIGLGEAQGARSIPIVTVRTSSLCCRTIPRVARTSSVRYKGRLLTVRIEGIPAMIRTLLGRRLDAAERRLGAPVDYLRHMLRVSMRAFFRFA